MGIGKDSDPVRKKQRNFLVMLYEMSRGDICAYVNKIDLRRSLNFTEDEIENIMLCMKSLGFAKIKSDGDRVGITYRGLKKAEEIILQC
ncbi:hypothetical protein CUJ83_08755 [Methanocella sp. CWC-04]|uniref:Uncharacterized protein n=1 Tax=Methanooceanicella nereidis TaxID=2052831 RepID=A0AAP2RE29_9EURY|nr:hypothetical protein [Methanocella sp. CWC-04]MCD1295086.1 hypothetical protein [Methanocella sp. CWC-04]